MSNEIDIVLSLAEAERLRDELLALRGATCVALTPAQSALTTRLLNTLIVRIAERTGRIVVSEQAGVLTIREVEAALRKEERR